MSDQINLIREFRSMTGLGLLEARNALVAANWDMDKAIEHARKNMKVPDVRRTHRETREGLVESYIHVGGKVGVLLEVNCETDFVARNDEFKQFSRNICLQIAASNPTYISKEDVPLSVVEKEKEIAEAQAGDKPPAAIARFVGGKMDRFYSTACLLEQTYVKQPDKTVGEVLNELINKTKENIRIRRFARFAVGS
jgi:elongation factor Ts